MISHRAIVTRSFPAHDSQEASYRKIGTSSSIVGVSGRAFLFGLASTPPQLTSIRRDPVIDLRIYVIFQVETIKPKDLYD